MRRAKDNPTVVSFSCVSSALEKAGEWHQALLLLGDMKVSLADQWNRRFVYTVCICVSHLGAALFNVVPFRNELLAFAHLCKDCLVLPNVITYSATISACSKGSQWQRAVAVAQTISD